MDVTRHSPRKRSGRGPDASRSRYDGDDGDEDLGENGKREIMNDRHSLLHVLELLAFSLPAEECGRAVLNETSFALAET